MDAAKELHFSIDGEYITDLSRSWFWEQDKPFEVCEKLLLSCMGTDAVSIDEKKSIVIEILEGRKKFIGINVLTLEEDNSNIRPLHIKLNEVRKELAIQKIENYMYLHPIDFVDPFSTVKSLEMAKNGSHYLGDEIITLQDCMNYFYYSENGQMFYDVNTATNAGLWLLQHSTLVYEAIGENIGEIKNPDFWDKMWIVMQEHPYFIEHKDFQVRNKKYLYSKRYKKEKEKRNRIVDNEKQFEFSEVRKENIEYVKEQMKLSEKDSYKEFGLSVILGALTDNSERERLCYFMKPDDIIKWEGLIAPNGDFYSCDFGGHSVKAFHIIETKPELFTDIDFKKITYDNALDELLKHGWCATRYLPTIGDYISVPSDVKSSKRITKAQKDKIWDAVIKFEIKVDTEKIL